MRKFFTVLMGMNLLFVAAAFAQEQGILPGEPDPNSSPETERRRDERVRNALIDDRSPCPKGQRRFHKMVCGPSEKGVPSCEKPTVLTECRKKARPLRCKGDDMAITVFKCPSK